MKKLVLTIAAFSALSATYAQKYMGIVTSNWSGTQSIYLNPSVIADSRSKLCVDLGSFNLFVDNNLASVDLSKIGTSGSVGDAFTFSKSGQFNIVLGLEARGPGVMYSIDDDNTVAITSRVRMFNQFNNFDRNLFQSVMMPDVTASNYAVGSKNFNWTAHIWSEFNLSYARVLYKEGDHFIKAGITLGRASGLGYVGIKGRNLDATYNSSDAILHASNSDIQFATSIANDAGALKDGAANIFGQFFGKKGGSGLRSDIGATYEYRPDHADWEGDRRDPSTNKYKVRASVAVTDIGAVKYKGNLQANLSGNGTLRGDSVAKNIVDGKDFTTYASTQGFHLDTPHADTKVHLPTALVIGADYYVSSHFYVNATWITNLANRQNFGNSLYGQVTISPRWDTKIFCAALPLTYSAMTKSVKVGLGLRLGGFFLGSDDMLLFLGGKAYGANYYMGAYVPIAKRHPKNHVKDAAGTPKTGG